MRSRHIALLLCLAVWWGCEPQAPPRSGRQASAQNATGARRVQTEDFHTISLDNPPAGAAISTQRNFYVVFDGSGSMANKIDVAKQATEEFIANVPDDVNLGLFVFDAQGVSERVPLGTDRQAFLEAVKAIRPDHGTPLSTAIRTATERLKEQYRKQLGYGEFNILIVTDGAANNGQQMVNMAVEAERWGMVLYTIGFGISGHSLEQYSYRYLPANDKAKLRDALSDMVAEPEDDWTPSN